jgi:hypothetical protein
LPIALLFRRLVMLMPYPLVLTLPALPTLPYLGLEGGNLIEWSTDARSGSMSAVPIDDDLEEEDDDLEEDEDDLDEEEDEDAEDEYEDDEDEEEDDDDGVIIEDDEEEEDEDDEDEEEEEVDEDAEDDGPDTLRMI